MPKREVQINFLPDNYHKGTLISRLSGKTSAHETSSSLTDLCDLRIILHKHSFKAFSLNKQI